jgi:cation:H+ antiporter
MKRILRESTSLLITTVAGSVLLVAGIVMLVTPGPGIVTIAAAIALLSRHHGWARTVRRRTSGRFEQAIEGAGGRAEEEPETT